MSKFSLLTLFLLLFTALSAQSRWTNNLEIGINTGTGYVLPEYQFFNLISEGPTSNFEFQIQKNTIGKTDWENIYNYPSYGIRYFYSDLGSPDHLGQAWGIYPYFQLDIFKYRSLSFVNQTGLGYSRVNQKFDLENNYLNVGVGSYSNFHFNTRFSLMASIGKKWKVSSALSLDHFSNANTAEPNLGVNWLSLLAGVSYHIGQEENKIQRELSEHKQAVEKELAYSIGGKHSRALLSEYYFTSSISFEVRKKYFRAFHLGVGADLFYDTSVKDQLEKTNDAYSNSDQFQSGIHISQTIVYNNFSLTFEEGVYLILKEKVEGYPIYTRGIVKYKFGEHFSLRFAMKSHFHILDYPEIGLGWVW